MLKGHTRKAQSLLAKIARFNCKPRLSAKLESEIKREDNQQQHFTVSDGEQEDTEGQSGETDKEASVSVSPVVVPRRQEKLVKSYVYLCATVRKERERERVREKEKEAQKGMRHYHNRYDCVLECN